MSARVEWIAALRESTLPVFAFALDALQALVQIRP
jgi:hypothetical protein